MKLIIRVSKSSKVFERKTPIVAYYNVFNRIVGQCTPLFTKYIEVKNQSVNFLSAWKIYRKFLSEFARSNAKQIRCLAWLYAWLIRFSYMQVLEQFLPWTEKSFKILTYPKAWLFELKYANVLISFSGMVQENLSLFKTDRKWRKHGSRNLFLN